jgi:RNA polymerase sigma factor (sigma-70 family)
MSSTVKKQVPLVPVTASVDNARTMEASAARRPSHHGARVPARLLRLASDDRLVDHVRSGSESAFEAVFDRHHRGILAFCRHMLGSAEEAEDAVQHVFMAAYRSLAGSTREIQLRPWLYTIARNRCLSVLRARRERPVEHLDELATENLSSEVQRRQDLRDILRDVAELPEEQRAALVLAEVGGVPHDEIALVLGVQREKVKALVFQARSSLIASRQARDTSCEQIREQLAELRGGALRRNTLRRHLKVCPGCREFRRALRDQRKLLAVALPVVPTLALKQGALASAFGSSAATAGGAAVAGGSLIAGGGASMTAKVVAVALVASGGVAGVKTVAPELRPATGTAPAADGSGVRGQHAPPTALGGKPEVAGAGIGEQQRSERAHGRQGEDMRAGHAGERAAGPDPEQASDVADQQTAVHGDGAPDDAVDAPQGAVKPPKAEQISELSDPAPTTGGAPAKPEKQPAPDQQQPPPQQQQQQQPPQQQQQQQQQRVTGRPAASATPVAAPGLPDAAAQADRKPA